jgi:hypothetical protein
MWPSWLSRQNVSAEDIAARYGPWVPPNQEAAE